MPMYRLFQGEDLDVMDDGVRIASAGERLLFDLKVATETGVFRGEKLDAAGVDRARAAIPEVRDVLDQIYSHPFLGEPVRVPSQWGVN